MANSIEKHLEQYTLEHSQEVLLVTAEIDGEPDEIMIFRGFSSSLMRSTSSDPDVPVLPNHAAIVKIDRIAGPYNSDCPQYLERDVSWDVFSKRIFKG